MIILVDMDGVLADCEAAFEKRVRNRLPIDPIPLDERDTFYAEDQYGEKWGPTLRAYMTETGFFRDLEPVDGAMLGVHKLQQAGHDVWICTSPITSPNCFSEKFEWVQKWLPSLQRKIILTKDKTLVHGDVLIDDKPEIAGANPNPTWEHIVFRSGSRNNGTFDWHNMEELL